MVLGVVLLFLQFFETWRDEGQEMKARGIAGALCLLGCVLLTAIGVNGLLLVLLTVCIYQAALFLTAPRAYRQSETLTNL
jgi:hypothetical protein